MVSIETSRGPGSEDALQLHLVNTPDIPHSEKNGIKQRIRKAAFELSRFAVLPHFAADVAVATYEFTDFLTDTSINKKQLTEQGLTGNGEPVVVIPGFGTHDGFVIYNAFRRKLTEEAGYNTYKSGIKRINWGNLELRIDEVKRQVEKVAQEYNSPVILIGHSLGGTIAQLIAVEEPELVASVDAFAAPLNAFPDKAVRSGLARTIANGALRINKETRSRLMVVFSAETQDGIPCRSYIPKNGMVLDLDNCRNDGVEVIDDAGESHIGSLTSSLNFRTLLSNLRQDRESRPVV